MIKKVSFIFLSGLIAVLFSCQPAATDTSHNAATAKPQTREDSLYKAVMAIHNEIMPKMGKLMGYEKKSQQQSDSIKAMLSHTSFPKEVAQHIATDVNTLDTLNSHLKAADDAMNDWMAQFDADPKMKTTEERANYFATQKEKATAMRNQFMEALQQADSLFGYKK